MAFFKQNDFKVKIIVCNIVMVLLCACTTTVPDNTITITPHSILEIQDNALDSNEDISSTTTSNTPNSENIASEVETSPLPTENGTRLTPHNIAEFQNNTSDSEDSSSPITSTLQVENNTQEVKDDGFLTGQPCGPPCFWSIVPGITTEAETVEVLKTKGLFQNCEPFNNEARSGDRGIICRYIMVVGFQLGTDVVKDIGFRPIQKIIVADVIKKYGEPNGVSVIGTSTPETPHSVVILYYDDIRTTITLPEQEGTTFLLEASTQIESIGYSDAASYSKSRRFLTDWQGYGEYESDW